MALLWHHQDGAFGMLPHPSMYLFCRHRWAVVSRVGRRLLPRLWPGSSSSVLATDSPRSVASSSS